jgi:hypothetical protein
MDMAFSAYRFFLIFALIAGYAYLILGNVFRQAACAQNNEPISTETNDSQAQTISPNTSSMGSF